MNRWIGKLQGIQLIVAASLLIRIALSLLFDLNLSVAYGLAPVSAYLLYLFLLQAQLPQPLSVQLPGDSNTHVLKHTPRVRAVSERRCRHCKS